MSEPTNGDNGRENRNSQRLDTGPLYESPFTVKGRVKSFRHAAMGIWFVLRSQHNAWLHAVATVLAFILAAVLHVSVRPFTSGQWCALLIAISQVWVAETFNTGLEVLAAAITSDRHPIVKIAKDVAAAAVLMSALAAAIVGAVLFVPPLAELIMRLTPAR
ncbi:MAG: diacylglycerol kinase family protein [Planctomycetota bacterium]|nr:diacylglycerol kinase family protein [Planctomycetota bacterium]